METAPKLFMIMLGCKPAGRLTEQHDIFFGIGKSLKELIRQIDVFWPDALGKWHIDVWREVTSVDGYEIKVVPKSATDSAKSLYFINLGGYKKGEFDEYHYKLLTVADDLAEAVKTAKQSAFYKHFGFAGAVSHIDDKYGVDVDDTYKVDDILSSGLKSTYSLEIVPKELPDDVLHIGYLTPKKIT